MEDLHRDTILASILRTLRASLHACPEPANGEATTAGIIDGFLRAYAPDEIHTGLGGHGVAAVYRGVEPGPTVLVRAELDALNVEDFDERGSPVAITAHRCGHDAHMTMLAGLAPLLARDRPSRGRVVLLFQPAEETGEGAARIIDDPQFQQIRPDAAIALHNLPGFPLGSVVTRAHGFASASVGMRVIFHGKDSHAGEPENARSPLRAIARLMEEVPDLSQPRRDDEPYRLATVTHAVLGRQSFGTTPGFGELWATLRAGSSDALRVLCDEGERRARRLAGESGLDVEIEWREGFPDTRNDPELNRLLIEECEASGIPIVESSQAFRWSEDFGHFGRVCPIVLFGLGVGEEAPALHTPAYAFPDEALEIGLTVHHRMIRRLLDHPELIPADHDESTPKTRTDLAESTQRAF